MPDIDDYEKTVKKGFLFLENDFGYIYAGLKVVQEDPRDSYVAVKYRRDGVRVDIVWNPLAMSLGVFVKMSNDELERREKFVYFEPFVEFISDGLIKPVVPQIYQGMSIGEIERVMEQRYICFQNGVSRVVMVLAERFRECYPMLESASTETIKKYHDWYLTRGVPSA